MLPPDMSEDEITRLPEQWYCKDKCVNRVLKSNFDDDRFLSNYIFCSSSINDPDRSSCDAPEITSSCWYNAYVWGVSHTKSSSEKRVAGAEAEGVTKKQK